MNKVALISFLGISGLLFSSAPPHDSDEILQKFFKAAHTGDTSELFRLPYSPQRLNQRDNYGHTPLYWAAFNGYYDVVRLMLARGSQPNLPDSTNLKSTPLGIALRRGHTEVVKELMNDSANTRVQDSTGETALSLAFAGPYPRAESVRILQQHGVRLSQLKGHPIAQMPLSLAVASGGLGTLKTLLARSKMANAERGLRAICDTEHKHHALSCAVYFNQIAATEILLSEGVSANSRMAIDNKNVSVLLYALMKNFTSIANLLRQRGATLDEQSQLGRTALSHAAERGDKELTELLLKHGALVNSIDDEGKTPLHYALLQEGNPCIEVLINHGADSEIQDKKQVSPLSYAVYKRMENAVRLMLRQSAQRILKLFSRVSGPENHQVHAQAKKAFLEVCGVMLGIAHRSPLLSTPTHTKLFDPQLIERIYGSLIDEVASQKSKIDLPPDKKAPSLPPTKDVTHEGSTHAWEVFKENIARSQNNEHFQLSYIVDSSRPSELFFNEEIKHVIPGRENEFVELILDLKNPLFSPDRFLATAINERNVALVTALLDRHKYQDTFLHNAVRLSSPEIVKLLLKRGANPKLTNLSGQTAVVSLLATLKEWREELTDIIEMLPNTLLPNDSLLIGLVRKMILYKAKPSSFIRIFKKFKVNLNTRDNLGKTLLHEKGLYRKQTSVQLRNIIALLVRHGADVNAQDTTGETPLHIYASRWPDYKDMTEALLACKAHNAIQDEAYALALEKRIQKMLNDMKYPLRDRNHDEDSEVFEMFVKYGLEIPEDIPSLPALIIANEPFIVESFLRNISIDRAALTQALHIAILFNRPVCLKILLEYGANPNGTWYTMSPLQHAVVMKREKCIKALVEAGAELEYKNQHLGTALSIAAAEKDLASVKELVAGGAHIEGKDAQGRTPLYLAIDGVQSEVLQTLLEGGAQVNTRNDYTLLTPLIGALLDVNFWPENELILDEGSDIQVLLSKGAQFLPYFDPVHFVQNGFWNLMPSHKEFDESCKRIFEAIRTLKKYGLSDFVISWILLSDTSVGGTKVDVRNLFMIQLGKSALAPSLLRDDDNPDPAIPVVATLFKLIKNDEERRGIQAFLTRRLRADLERIRKGCEAINSSDAKETIKAIDTVSPHLEKLIKKGINERYNLLENAGKLLAAKNSRVIQPDVDTTPPSVKKNRTY